MSDNQPPPSNEELSVEEANHLMAKASNSPEGLASEFVKLFSTKQGFRNYVLRASGLQQKERSFGTYYKREYALQLKPFIDQMIASESKAKDTRFLLAHFPNTKLGTLRARIEQSLKYLIREMDVTNTYLNFKDKIEVCMEPDGIYIRWRTNLRKKHGDLVGELVELKEDWRERLDNYLASAVVGQTYEERVSLEDSQVEELTSTISQLNTPTHFVWACNITQNLIKIVRVAE